MVLTRKKVCFPLKQRTKVSLLLLLITHQLLAYANDVNSIGDDIKTKDRNADVLLNACKDIGLAVNTGKTKYMGTGRH